MATQQHRSKYDVSMKTLYTEIHKKLQAYVGYALVYLLRSACIDRNYVVAVGVYPEIRKCNAVMFKCKQ